MKRSLTLLPAIVGIVGIAAPSMAQLPATTSAGAIEDPNIRDAVVAAAVRNGKLALATKAYPSPNYLPTGTFKSESSARLIVRDGFIVGFASGDSKATPIGSIRLNSQGVVMLTLASAAGATQIELIVPPGTYTSDTGRSSLTIVSGRPTRFTPPGSTQGLHEVNDQPAPVRR